MNTAVEDQRVLALAAARLGWWMWDIASGRTVWDAQLEALHGLPPGGFGGTFEDWLATLHPDDQQECLARVQSALAEPGPYLLMHRTIWPDRSVHVIECRGTVLLDSQGQPTGTTGVAIDVTERERLVQTLQRSLLPPRLPTVPGVTVAARYQPDEEVGGDWYAVIALPGGRLGLAIGDVAGHGLDAVEDMAAARFSLRALALTDPDPEVVLDRLNRMVEVFEADALITALYGVLDPGQGTWRYASAGHMPAVIRRPDGSAELLDLPCDPPLGAGCAFRAREVAVEAGTTLVLYTDGLVERRRADTTDGLERLRDACAEAPADPEALCDHLLKVMLGDEVNEDDVAILAITIDDGEPAGVGGGSYT